MDNLDSTYLVVLASPEVSAGELQLLARLGARYPVIAVDGGFAWCRQAGVPIAYAIGDFDSLGYVPREREAACRLTEKPMCARIDTADVRGEGAFSEDGALLKDAPGDTFQTKVFPCKKDQTDFELALDLAQRLGAHEILVFAAFGGRPDHALANEQVMAHAAESGVAVTAFGENFALDVLCGPSELRLEAQLAGTVSLLAMTPEVRGVCIEGLEYALHDGTLSARTSRGVSNEFRGAPAYISVESGTLFIFHSLNSN